MITVLIGTVIVPAVRGTPTTTWLELRATPENAVFALAIVDEKMIPEARVSVAVAVPEHAPVVPEVPNPETVAVPVPVHVNVTVKALDPVAVNATFETVIDPLATARDTAGPSWRFVDPVM